MKSTVLTIATIFVIAISGCIFDDSHDSPREQPATTDSYWIVWVYDSATDEDYMRYIAITQSGSTFSVTGSFQSENGSIQDSTFTFTYNDKTGLDETQTVTVTGTMHGESFIASADDGTSLRRWTGTVFDAAATDSFLFPLSIGTTWEYTGIGHEVNIRNAPAGKISPDTLFTAVSQLEVITSDVIPDLDHCYFLRETTHTLSDGVPGEYCSYGCYLLAQGGLYQLAYDGSAFTLPKVVAQDRSPLFNETPAAALRDEDLSEEDLIHRSTPLMRIPYPVSEGFEWVISSGAFKTAKRVIGSETVTVPAGTFDCHVIQTLRDMDNDGLWDEDFSTIDYVSSIGLVKRRDWMKDLTGTYPETDPWSPGPSSGESYLYDYVQEHVLTSYQIN